MMISIFVPLTGDPAVLRQYLNDSGNNFLRMFRALMNYAVEIGADVLQKTGKVCSDAELIIHTFMHTIGGHTSAFERNVPMFIYSFSHFYFYWRLSKCYITRLQLRSVLQKFLKACETPICVSFGSMINRTARNINYTVRESLK